MTHPNIEILPYPCLGHNEDAWTCLWFTACQSWLGQAGVEKIGFLGNEQHQTDTGRASEFPSPFLELCLFSSFFLFYFFGFCPFCPPPRPSISQGLPCISGILRGIIQACPIEQLIWCDTSGNRAAISPIHCLPPELAQAIRHLNGPAGHAPLSIRPWGIFMFSKRQGGSY